MENKSNNRKKGNKAEDIAAKFLENKGYKIIKRNFYFGKNGEIDIVAEHGEYLVFVEVKSSKTIEYGHPLEKVSQNKIRKFRRAAEGYLYVNKITDKPIRIDLIAILGSENPEITHIENAF